MLALIPIVVASLVVSFVLTPFLRDFFSFLGVVDKPDSYRKTHLRPIPRLGGIGLAVAYFLALITLVLGWWRGLFSPEDPSIRLVANISPAIVLIFAVGLYDDVRGLSPWKKLVGQTVAAVWACWMGVHLAVPDPRHRIMIYVLSVIWLVLCANAFNLIDGLDGLATGVALIAATSLLMAALIHHNPGLALVITPLIGALLGFLYYNFNPASIFLGDCGSLLVGFLLGCYGLMWNQHVRTGLGAIAPLIALAFPVGEVMLSIMRRFLRKRPIFGSDKNHIHHRIVSLGLSQKSAALVLYAASALVAILAVLQTILRPTLATVLLALFAIAGYVAFRFLRYREFDILGAFLFRGGFRSMLRTDIQLHEYQESLAAAKTMDECWTVLRNTCRDASFTYVTLNIDGTRHEDQFAHSANCQRISIAFSGGRGVSFGYDPAFPELALLIAPLAACLQDKLDPSERQRSGLEAWQASRFELNTLKTKTAVAP